MSDGRIVRAVVAVATFAAARDVADAIAARRRGAHPSELRDAVAVRADLAVDLDAALRGWRSLGRRLHGLDRAGARDDVRAADTQDDTDGAPTGPHAPLDAGPHADAVEAARVADALLTAQHVARHLRRVHQHLLGLVAAGVEVDTGSVEAARGLASDLADLADGLPTGASVDALDTRIAALAAELDEGFGEALDGAG